MIEKLIKAVPPQVGIDVASAIEALNLAAIGALLKCASSGDPLAHLMLGVDKAVLDELRSVRKHEFMIPVRAGSLSFVKLRFNKVETWRALREGGFSRDVVMRELIKEPGFGEHF